MHDGGSTWGDNYPIDDQRVKRGVALRDSLPVTRRNLPMVGPQSRCGVERLEFHFFRCDRLFRGADELVVGPEETTRCVGRDMLVKVNFSDLRRQRGASVVICF